MRDKEMPARSPQPRRANQTNHYKKSCNGVISLSEERLSSTSDCGLSFEQNPIGENVEEERRLFQKVFDNAPKIRKKPYKKRSVKKTCEELVNSFCPLTEVTYDAMRNRLIAQFERCSRQTIN